MTMVNNVIAVLNYVIAARPSLLNFMIADRPAAAAVPAFWAGTVGALAAVATAAALVIAPGGLAISGAVAGSLLAAADDALSSSGHPASQ